MLKYAVIALALLGSSAWADALTSDLRVAFTCTAESQMGHIVGGASFVDDKLDVAIQHIEVFEQCGFSFEDFRQQLEQQLRSRDSRLSIVDLGVVTPGFRRLEVRGRTI